MRRRIRTGFLLAALLLPCCGRVAVDLLHDVPAVAASGSVNVVVEIPAGTLAKFEVDKTDGRLRQERVGGAPRVVGYLAYPANYGMVPQTLLPAGEGGDGDPLDAIVLGTSIPRGEVVPTRIVGVLRLVDGGERDDKLLAVPEDGPFAGISDVAELRERFPGVTEILETWFTHYKGPGETVSRGFDGAEAAREILERARAAYATVSPDGDRAITVP